VIGDWLPVIGYPLLGLGRTPGSEAAAEGNQSGLAAKMRKWKF
jgi:hypothetical protein